jgi:hypothetical protein
MGGIMNPAAAQRPATIRSPQRHIELLKAHLEILKQLNASPKLTNLAEQALRAAEENLQQESQR